MEKTLEDEARTFFRAHEKVKESRRHGLTDQQQDWAPNREARTFLAAKEDEEEGSEVHDDEAESSDSSIGHEFETDEDSRDDIDVGEDDMEDDDSAARRKSRVRENMIVHGPRKRKQVQRLSIEEVSSCLSYEKVRKKDKRKLERRLKRIAKRSALASRKRLGTKNNAERAKKKLKTIPGAPVAIGSTIMYDVPGRGFQKGIVTGPHKSKGWFYAEFAFDSRSKRIVNIDEDGRNRVWRHTK